MLTLKTAVGAGFVVLLLNTGYLSAFATPSIFYMANVLLHLVLGVTLAVAFAWLLKREPDLRRPLIAPAVFFAMALAFALWLVSVGNLREHRWILNAHIVSSVLGVIALLPFLVRLSRIVGRPRTLSLSVGNAALVAAALPLVTAVYVKANPNPNDRIVNPSETPVSMSEEGGGPGSPFFPSSAKTNAGGIIPSNFFMDSEACGSCHKDIFEQWNSSAHHFASFNNQFYRKSIEYMQDVVGTQAKQVVRRLSRPCGVLQRPVRNADQAADRYAGSAGGARVHVVPCDHARRRDRWGRVVSRSSTRPLHELMSSKNKYIRAMDGFMTYLNPEPHRRTFMKPFMTLDSPEFCSSCHKVHLDVPVNDYRWFRGFNDYDAWQASGVSGQGARSFYYPPSADDVCRTATCRRRRRTIRAAMRTARCTATGSRRRTRRWRSSTRTKRR